MAATANFAFLVALGIALAVKLWPDWVHDPDLSHGFLAPFACLILLWESRRQKAWRLDVGGGVATAAWLLLLLGGLGALGASGLFAATVDWSSPLVNFVLALAFSALAGAALVAYSGGGSRGFPLNWASCSAVLIWPLCAPIPPGTYSRLTIALQLRLSELVVHTLHGLGFAAHRDGNIIQLAHGTVGVEDACSGIRSLISCVFAGVFLSAVLVRRPWARVALVGLSVPIALGMNFIRSLALTMLVERGVDIGGAWHDGTGYAILVVTACLLAGLALLLGGKRRAVLEGPSEGRTDTPVGRNSVPIGTKCTDRYTLSNPPPSPPSHPAQQVILSSGFACAAGLIIFFWADTRPSTRVSSTVPTLADLFPAAPPGWRVETNRTLYRFSPVLRTDHLAERTYTRHAGSAGAPERITIYVAYWQAGQAPVGLVATHTPDACWPGTGWEAQPIDDPQVEPTLDGHLLPTAQHRYFINQGYPQHVWFWHLYEGRSLAYIDPHSIPALFEIALCYGFRRNGDQAFIRVSSNRPWDEIGNEPVVSEFLRRARILGL